MLSLSRIPPQGNVNPRAFRQRPLSRARRDHTRVIWTCHGGRCAIRAALRQLKHHVLVRPTLTIPTGGVNGDAGLDFVCATCREQRAWRDLAGWSGPRRFCESCTSMLDLIAMGVK